MKEKLTVVSKVLGQATIFYDANLYLLDLEELKKLALAQRIRGRITGYEIDRIDDGEITLFYNPIIIKETTFKTGVRKITEYITSRRNAGR